MSVHHLSHVLNHSKAEHSDRLVMISLANHANDEDVAYPGVATICRETRLGDSTVRTALSRLVETGELELLDEKSRWHTRVYRLIRAPSESSTVRNEQIDRQNRADRPSDFEGKPTEEPSEEPSLADSGQLFEHDPVKEVFEHYCNTVPGKANSRLSQETRRLIKRALDERPIDQLKLAITGLASSPHHLGQNDTGTEYLQIKYAIGKVRVSESIGDRVDQMAAKAPKQSSSGEITVDELLRTVPSDRHWIIRDNMSNVIAAINRGDRATLEEERLLRSPGVEPVINDGKFGGWRKVS